MIPISIILEPSQDGISNVSSEFASLSCVP
jgi:hypothetical protein